MVVIITGRGPRYTQSVQRAVGGASSMEPCACSPSLGVSETAGGYGALSWCLRHGRGQRPHPLGQAPAQCRHVGYGPAALGFLCLRLCVWRWGSAKAVGWLLIAQAPGAPSCVLPAGLE